MIESREWIFRVVCPVNPGESVYLTGSCPKLGCWDPEKLIPLVPEGSQNTETETIWKCSLYLPIDKVEFRFCVCEQLKIKSDFANIVKRWETDIHPRIVPPNDTNATNPSLMTFGIINEYEKISQGWLINENALYLRLMRSTIHCDPIDLWKNKYKNKKVYLKATPMDMNKRVGHELDFQLDESTDSELTDLRARGQAPYLPTVEVSVLRQGSNNFESQQQFGVKASDEECIVFGVRIAEDESIGFLLDYYIESADGELPHYIGCSFVLPSTFKDNYGVASLPITSPKHKPIGQLTLSYMLVRPLSDHRCDLRVSYARHWKESWRGLEVGHRGAGNSFHAQTKNCANIRENTIASLHHASESGADMVEFDVQLSKDLVPLLYHDFHMNIAPKYKIQDVHEENLITVPIKQFTHDQLRNMKVYHSNAKDGSCRFNNETDEDHQPFPTLQKTLESVDVSCGFNVEIKWTMLRKDGSYELEHPLELNRFLDKILKVVLENASSRKIVFSCFHPDICSMIRLKQNLYPVLFLTMGQLKRWPDYDDVRTKSIESAVLFASSADILGVNVFTNDLLRDASQIQMAFDHNLVVFCWGDENSDQNTITHLKELGLHGIIYDKIDVYNTKKDKKRNGFLCDDRETCRCSPLSCKGTSPPADFLKRSFSSTEASPSSPPLGKRLRTDTEPSTSASEDEIAQTSPSFGGVLAMTENLIDAQC